MISPDGTSPPPRRPRTSRAAFFIAAALIIVIGYVALGSLSRPDPVPSAETTTSSTTTSTTIPEETEPTIDLEDFDVAQIATGDPLEWEPALTRDEGYPIALVTHAGAVYVFASGTPDPGRGDPGGLRGWRSRNGLDWEPLGQVIPESHRVTMVETTDQGLLAMGPGAAPDGPRLWHSDDGSTWDPEEIPVTIGELMSWYPQSIAANQDLVIISGYAQIDVARVVADSLGLEFQSEYPGSASGWTVDVFDGEIELSLNGPGAFPIVKMTSDDLGLSREQRDAIIRAYSGGAMGSRMLLRDGSGWRETTIPEADFVDTVTTDDNGDLIVGAYGPSGLEWWVTKDGISWETSADQAGPYRQERWGDRLVGPADTGGSILMKTEDGAWEEIGLADRLPDRIQWGTTSIAGGPGGLAAVVLGSGPRLTNIPDGEFPSISSDGAVLTLDFAANRFLIELGGDSYEWVMRAHPEGIDVDPDRGLVDFADPDSGEHIASFRLEAIVEALRDYRGQSFPTLPPHRAFAFTDDGEEWVVQDLATLGHDIGIPLLEVTDSRVIAVANGALAFFLRDPSPGFTVVTAPVP